MLKSERVRTSGLRWLWLTACVMLVDRLTKLWVLHHLMFLDPQRVTSFFNLTLALNTGASFGFLHNASGWQNVFLSSLAGFVAIFILVWLSRLAKDARWTSIALCFILGGALGNAWDRLSYHYVIDFLDFHLHDWHFAIFNIADTAICVGAAMLLLSWMHRADHS
ncbi:MAG TPA: signal peptidase II [Gammaproteobacteria bacterium]|nr:signal peptidase II [Gammaproteobacteria bacterium]